MILILKNFFKRVDKFLLAEIFQNAEFFQIAEYWRKTEKLNFFGLRDYIVSSW